MGILHCNLEEVDHRSHIDKKIQSEYQISWFSKTENFKRVASKKIVLTSETLVEPGS